MVEKFKGSYYKKGRYFKLKLIFVLYVIFSLTMTGLFIFYIVIPKIKNYENRLSLYKEVNESYAKKLENYSALENIKQSEIDEKNLQYIYDKLRNYTLSKYLFIDDLSNDFAFPVEYPELCYIPGASAEYGRREIKGYPQLKFHHGTDPRLVYHENILSMGNGIVHNIGYNDHVGKYIIIYHQVRLSEYVTVYFHLSEIMVLKNQEIKKGQIIGKVGNTGKYCLSKEILHFGVYKKKDGKWFSINPFQNSLYKKHDKSEFHMYQFLLE